MNCETSTIMDTLHLFIAATLALVATAQGILLSLLSLSLGGCTCMYVNIIWSALLTEQVSAIALMEMLSLSRTQLILV